MTYVLYMLETLRKLSYGGGGREKRSAARESHKLPILFENATTKLYLYRNGTVL